MKRALLALMMLAMLSACTHKKAAYTCMCSTRATGQPNVDSTFQLGEISKTDAYSQCTEHNNAVDTCDMLIMN